MADAAVVEKKEETPADAAVAKPEKPLSHPLNTEWTLWWDFSYNNSSDNWEKNLKQLATITTVEEWWGVYNQIPKASELPPNGNLSLFRKGVRPVPHDSINMGGGEYIVRNFEDCSFDDVWMRSVLFCIGEVSPKDYNLVVGTHVAVKKTQKTITMWITTTEKKDLTTVKRLGKLYKEQIGLGARKMRLPFRPHDKSEIVEKKKDADGAAAAAPATTDAPSEAAAAAEPQP